MKHAIENPKDGEHPPHHCAQLRQIGPKALATLLMDDPERRHVIAEERVRRESIPWGQFVQIVVLIVKVGVVVRIDPNAANRLAARAHHLHIMLERGRLLVHHKRLRAQPRLAERALLGRRSRAPRRRSRVPPPLPPAVVMRTTEDEQVNVVRHVEVQRVDGVGIRGGASGDPQRARHSRDEELPTELAALPGEVREAGERMPANRLRRGRR